MTGQFWAWSRQDSGRWVGRAQNPVSSFPGSPFRVPVKDVVDPSQVKIAGTGVGSGVRARIQQSFTVDSSKAGLAPLEVRVLGPRGEYASSLVLIFTCPGAAAVTQNGYLAFDFGLELKIKFLKILCCSKFYLKNQSSFMKAGRDVISPVICFLPFSYVDLNFFFNLIF